MSREQMLDAVVARVLARDDVEIVRHGGENGDGVGPVGFIYLRRTIAEEIINEWRVTLAPPAGLLSMVA